MFAFKAFDRGDFVASVIVTLLPLLAIGCGKATPPSSTPIVVDAEFQSIVAAFETDMAAHGVDRSMEVSIQFGEPGSLKGAEPSAIGTCTISDSNKSILILKSYWDSATDDERKRVVYHELGHCVLGRVHDLVQETLSYCTGPGQFDLSQSDCPSNLWFQEERPISIMYPSTPPDVQLSSYPDRQDYESRMVDELFSGPGSLATTNL